MDLRANVFAVRDKSWLLYIQPKRLPYKDVTGGVNYSEGIGIALIRLIDTGQIAPVFVNPTAPRYTFSLSALKTFCGIPKVQETMMESCTFQDSKRIVTKVPCFHNNGLDFIDIEVFKMRDATESAATINQLTKDSREPMTMI